MTSTLNHDTIETPPIDAATVMLVRDATPGIEVLLLCRGNSRTVMNNAWVFPGGKIDNSDYATGDAIVHTIAGSPAQRLAEPHLDPRQAAAIFSAACRETHEETGVTVTAALLHPWSRWITPKEPAMMKKRFDARFFVARMPADQDAVHDGVEATDSAWFTPRSALHAYYEKEITLAPPQIMSLASLSRHQSAESCIAYARAHPPHRIEPGIVKDNNGGRTLIYPGDPDHTVSEQIMPGPTRLKWQNNRFEPEAGLEGFFDT